MLSSHEDQNSQRKRNLRKSKRQIKNAFVPIPCRIHRWSWYDCVFCFFAGLLMLYSFFAMGFTARYIRNYRVRGKQIREGNVSISVDVMQRYNYLTGTPFAVSLLVIELYLFFLMVFVMVWLRYLRNIGFFVILAIAILIGSIYFFTLGGMAIYKSSDKDDFKKVAFNFVTNRLEEKEGSFLYEQVVKSYSEQNLCCGMRSFRDWGEWNNLSVWNVDVKVDSIPVECCQNHTEGTELNDLQDECQNTDVLQERDNSARLKKINTLGCGDVIWDLVTKDGDMVKYICHGVILGLLLLLFLFLFYLLLRRYRRVRRRRKKGGEGGSFENPWEQEDLVESEIIPGTPAKSLMSASENTFYAP